MQRQLAEAVEAIGQEDQEDVIGRLIERTAQELADRLEQIVPERVYPLARAAHLLGNDTPRAGKTLAEWPESVLPRIPITPGGGKVGVYGRDLIRLIHQLRGPHAPRLEP